MAEAVQFLKTRGVSSETTALCLSHLQQNNKQTFVQQARGIKLLEKLPQQIQLAIKSEGYFCLLKQVEQLKYNFSHKFLRHLASIVKERVIVNDEIVLQKDNILDKFYLFSKENEIQFKLEFGIQSHDLRDYYQLDRNKLHQDLKYFLTGSPCPFSIQSSCNKIVPFITIEDFKNVLKYHQKDYEKYCMLRDQLQLEVISFNRCNSCFQFNHDVLKCSMLHFYPDKSIFYKFSDIQQRQYKERQRYIKHKSLKIRESIRYDLVLIRWHQVAEKNKLTNTRNLFNQLLTLSDSHFYKTIPKVKLFKRTNKEKRLKQLMLCSNLDNVLASPSQNPSIIETRADVPRSTYIQVGPGRINSQMVYDRVHISDESNKLGGIENVQSSGTIVRKSVKKESYHPTQRNSLSGQATQIGSASQFRSSQLMSQQNFQNIFTQNYHGIYSNLSRSNSENVISLLKNEATTPQSNMLNAGEETYQNTSQLSVIQYPNDEDDFSKIKFSNNQIPYQQDYQNQQTESAAPSHLIIPYGNKDCNSGFSNIDFFENLGKSSQMDNLISTDKKQIIQRISSKKKSQNQLSVINPLIQSQQMQQSQSFQSMLLDNKQIQKRLVPDSALQLDDEVYENYKYLQVFFSELKDKKKRKSTKTSTFFQKENRLTTFDSNKSMKELRFMVQQIKREYNYSEHIFGPLEFTFDKIYQYIVYYPSYNYEVIIEKCNLKIEENQKFQRLKTLKSLKKKKKPTIFRQQN